MNVNIVSLFNRLEHVQVVIQSQLRMKPTLDHYCRTIGGYGFFNLFKKRFLIQDISFRVCFFLPKGTEAAPAATDICIVNIPVNNKRNYVVRMFSLTC
ncbi:MAG: hypothetical protein A4E52_01968 [Pelotomaculum sp. PtaB.Bin013]|nr:MAG: hypothetical protein A4E52_01968 [Pelotomaculum sp. PtaB.Bin013]